MRRKRAVTLLLGGALAAAGAVSAFPAARAWWRHREANPLTRGRALAEANGCFSCHGPDGTEGILNPGAKGEKVPGWSGGTAMMYLDDPGDVREYVADGLPAKKRASKSYTEQLAKAKIQMPAYRDVLSDRELADVVAYVEAVAGLGGPPEGTPAAKGRDEAREHGCFSCHGVDGAGLVRNPGSFKGYVPGWRGPDYDELVGSDAELRQWILDGGIPRLTESRLARRYIERQKTQMPAYKGTMPDEHLDAIVAYIQWLRGERAAGR